MKGHQEAILFGIKAHDGPDSQPSPFRFRGWCEAAWFKVRLREKRGRKMMSAMKQHLEPTVGASKSSEKAGTERGGGWGI